MPRLCTSLPTRSHRTTSRPGSCPCHRRRPRGPQRRLRLLSPRSLLSLLRRVGCGTSTPTPLLLSPSRRRRCTIPSLRRNRTVSSLLLRATPCRRRLRPKPPWKRTSPRRHSPSMMRRSSKRVMVDFTSLRGRDRVRSGNNIPCLGQRRPRRLLLRVRHLAPSPTGSPTRSRRPLPLVRISIPASKSEPLLRRFFGAKAPWPLLVAPPPRVRRSRQRRAVLLTEGEQRVVKSTSTARRTGAS